MFATPLDEDTGDTAGAEGARGAARAELRPLEPWQAEEFLAHMDRARSGIDPWIPFAARATDPESARALLQDYADRQAADRGRIYGIWLEGTLVGGVLFPVFDAASGNCEIGCWLEPAGQGRGLVTKAARRLVDWAFAERGMHRVEWVVSAGNERSIAVAKRLGMTLDGVLRQKYPHRGERHDTQIWSLLAAEWRGPAATAG
jgi:RimJ/RimL family protein N-acetyltransferase